MLVTEYLVGADEDGKPLCLVVKEVLPLDCQPGRSELVHKVNRQDLIMEFLQDGLPVDWILFPDLPAAVVELLERGESLRVIDKPDHGEEVDVHCSLSPYSESYPKVGVC
jgi:hypothetical protein